MMDVIVDYIPGDTLTMKLVSTVVIFIIGSIIIKLIKGLMGVGLSMVIMFILYQMLLSLF